MKEQKELYTDKTVIEVTYFGQPNKLGGTINSREKKVSVNGELIYTEWQSWPQFHHKENTSVALENLERQLSFRQHTNCRQERTGNSGKLAKFFKIVWAKLFNKIINFKT